MAKNENEKKEMQVKLKKKGWGSHRKILFDALDSNNVALQLCRHAHHPVERLCVRLGRSKDGNKSIYQMCIN